MQTKIIESGEFKLTVSEATTLQGMRRTLLQFGMQNADRRDDHDQALQILQTITYPDLVGSVSKAVGFEMWPISFETFCELPDKFVAKWEKAAYEVNPHWEPGYNEAEEKKELTTSVSASPAGISDGES